VIAAANQTLLRYFIGYSRLPAEPVEAPPPRSCLSLFAGRLLPSRPYPTASTPTNYHDRKPPTITGWLERRRPASQGHGHDHVSPPALALAASLRPRAGAPETTRLGSRLPDVPLQFEAIQIQDRSGKLPLGSGPAKVEQQ
jgi:hypothetical protein